jgi:NADH:ubiquinone reductase (H+-translocating)
MRMKKVVIIGGGFAGLACAWKLCNYSKHLQVILIDKKETADFLPMLPDIIGRGIASEYLSFNLRNAGKKYGYIFIQGEVSAVEPEKKAVTIGALKVSYDYLVIASGSETNFYGNQNLKQSALKLDDVEDAKKIISSAGEFDVYIIAGGGYTGIEIAAALRISLKKHKRQSRIIIVERGQTILGPLPDWMKAYVLDNLKRLDIEVLTNKSVDKIEGRQVIISDGNVINNAVVIWAAGVKAAEFIQNLNVAKNQQGRIKVDEYLRLNESCFVIGDAANFSYKDSFLRMAVQFSIAEGRCAAENIARSIRGMRLRKYKPLDLGYIIPMANNRSCGTVLGLNLKGLLPTPLHFTMCIYRSLGLRNKMGVLCSLLNGKKEGCMMNLASLVLRLGLGLMFMAHGAQKALGLFGGPGIKGFSEFLAGLGFTPSLLWAYLAAYVELLGGLLLIIGFLTRISSMLLLILMAVAFWKVHAAKGFFLSDGGFEYIFIIACALIALIILGTGKFGINKQL